MAQALPFPLRRTPAPPSKKWNVLRALAPLPWKCCIKCFVLYSMVTVKTCRRLKRSSLIASPNLPPPFWKKSCGRPWLLLMAQPLKHRQSDCAYCHNLNAAGNPWRVHYWKTIVAIYSTWISAAVTSGMHIHLRAVISDRCRPVAYSRTGRNVSLKCDFGTALNHP